MSKSDERKRKSSVDYPLLARKLIEASGDMKPSKLSNYSEEASNEATLSPGLYIVATPIGHTGDISLRALLTLADVDMIACEDTRTSGSLLARYGIKKQLISYHDHNDDEKRPILLKDLLAGKTLALISDAGMPLISDPGYKLVRESRALGIKVTVIPGANAALTALAGSGLPTYQFLFAGFLPPKTAARQKAIARLKAVPATLVFYESPQRLSETLKDLSIVLGQKREASVARELTKLFEETRNNNLSELATYYEQHDVKGEIVILIGPPPEDEITFDLDALLLDHLKTLSVRDAVDAVGEITGSKKSDIYARALYLAKKRDL